MADEQVIWKGTPSQVLNFWWFVACLLIIPIPFAIYRWLVIRSRVYTITTERLRYKEGILNKREEEIEIYRIRDYSIKQPFFLRMFGKGNIELVTSDKSHPQFVLEAVPEPEQLRDQIRRQVEVMRKKKGVREMDIE